MKKSAYLCHRLQYGSVSARGGRTLKMATSLTAIWPCGQEKHLLEMFEKSSDCL